MSDSSDRGPHTFVVFVDSLGPDDVQHMPFVSENCFDGTMNAGNPFVTPKVMGEIYTGKNPAEHGMPSVSRYETDSRTRPAAPTLPEIVAESDEYGNVCNFGLPFIAPPQADTDDVYWHASEAMGNRAVFPQEAAPQLTVPGPAGDLSHPDEEDEALFNHRVDNCRATFAAARTIVEAHDFDVMFISMRLPDSYCHYRFDAMAENGQTHRDMLLQHVIDKEIQELAMQGDVFVFGDHGARDLTDVFRINRWLLEHGYLDAEIDYEWIEKSREYGLMEESDAPGEQLMVESPGVTIDESASVAVSADPFSTGLTLLDGADEDNVEAMIEDLEATEYIEEVEWSAEKWDGPLLGEAPDLYPRRAPGVFVSGNVHEERGGPEITRSGVHHPIGAWGSTKDLPSDGEENVTPIDLHSIILNEYLGVYAEDAEGGDAYDATVSEEDEEAVRDRLADLGYL